MLWGPINPLSTICIEKGWAYGPIPSLRIKGYPRTNSKGRSENYTLGRGKKKKKTYIELNRVRG